MEKPSYWSLNPEYFNAMLRPEFAVGQQVEFKDPKGEMAPNYGSGPFTVISVRNVQDEMANIMSVGHRQWVQLSKQIPLNGKPTEVVYDSFQRQWAPPCSLSYFGKIHPTSFSGAWIKPFDQEKK